LDYSLSIHEAANALRISKESMYNLLEQGLEPVREMLMESIPNFFIEALKVDDSKSKLSLIFSTKANRSYVFQKSTKP
jgi:hypothetical protein